MGKYKKKKATSGKKQPNSEIRGTTINLPTADSAIHDIQPEEAGNDQDGERGDGFEYVIKGFPVFDTVIVSFELPYHGWKKLAHSKFWHQACKHLSGIQKGRNQM